MPYAHYHVGLKILLRKDDEVLFLRTAGSRTYSESKLSLRSSLAVIPTMTSHPDVCAHDPGCLASRCHPDRESCRNGHNRVPITVGTAVALGEVSPSRFREGPTSL